MATSTYINSRLGYVVDHSSIARSSGRQVDYDKVPATSPFQNEDSEKYVKGGTIMSQLGTGKVVPRAITENTVTALTETGGTATATAAAHGYETGTLVTISGANQTEYNGTHEITVTDEDTFTFDCSGSPDDATGTVIAIVKATQILETNAIAKSKSAALNGQSTILGGVLYKNLLPDSGDEDFNTYLTELKEAGSWMWETYADSRGS